MKTHRDVVFQSMLHYGDASMSVNGLENPPRVCDDENVFSALLRFFQATRVRNGVVLTPEHGVLPILIAKK
jgi:hypothetical protein